MNSILKKPIFMIPLAILIVAQILDFVKSRKEAEEEEEDDDDDDDEDDEDEDDNQEDGDGVEVSVVELADEFSECHVELGLFSDCKNSVF